MNTRFTNSKILFLIAVFFFILQPVDDEALRVTVDDEYILSPSTVGRFEVLVHDAATQTVSTDLTADDETQCAPLGNGDSVQLPCLSLHHISYGSYSSSFTKTTTPLALQDVIWQHTTTSL